MADVVISARNLFFSYQEAQYCSIQDVNFDIFQGEIILLTGDSGSGKSTLLKCLNGLIPNTVEGELRGSLEIGKEAYFKKPMYELNRYIGSVFQNPRSQFFTTNTTSEMVFPMENYGFSRKDMDKKLHGLIEEFSLHELVDRDIFTLSSGERQLVALASSKTLDQKILLFDEPSANLDYGNAMRLSKYIEHLKKSGATVIVADHRFFYLKNLIDRVFLM